MPAGEGSAFTPIPGRRSRRDPVRRGGAAGRPRQLRLLPDAETADPRKPDAAPLRQGAGQGPRLSRRLPRRLSRTPLHRPLRRERSDQRCEKRRLNPLGGEPVDSGQASGLPTPPQAEQNQKKRTFDVLPKPDNLIRYRQKLQAVMARIASTGSNFRAEARKVVGRIARGPCGCSHRPGPRDRARENRRPAISMSWETCLPVRQHRQHQQHARVFAAAFPATLIASKGAR